MGMVNEKIWKILNNVYCCFKKKNFTVIVALRGVCYLFVKNTQYSTNFYHKWEKFKLNFYFYNALKELDDLLHKWPKEFLYFNKLRLIKYFQLYLRSKRINKKCSYQLNSC